MSRPEDKIIDHTSEGRQSRTNSVALPACGSFLPVGGNHQQPPLPRRHSETPTVRRIPPPIPARMNNEPPIFLTNNNTLKCDDHKAEVVKQCDVNERQSWQCTTSTSNKKLIDIEKSRYSDKNCQVKKLNKNAEFSTSKFDDDDGDDDDDSVGNFECNQEEHLESSFNELQKAARDLEKRLLHNDNEPINNQKINSINLRQQCTKFETEIEDQNDIDKRSKFEALQAASKNLERRLQCEQQQQQPKTKYNIEIDRAKNMMQNNLRKERCIERLEKLPKATQTNLPPPLSAIICQTTVTKPASVRQDSNVSSDSYSQTSSPSYTSKTMEAPLLPHKHINGRVPGRAMVPDMENPPGSPITKSISTPASLQTIVRFHSGSNMSLHHRIIRDIRRPSSHYVTRGRLQFRFAQVLVNAIALLAIAGGFLAYFKSYPQNVVKYENKTMEQSEVILKESTLGEQNNPSPGLCLPVIVNFCLNHKVPYNFTVFPNYMGNFNQRDAQHELENYEAVVDVRCYELAALFLCNVFVPKCGSKGQVVRPCRSLCYEMTRRCGFFLNVFGLRLPDYLACEFFPENLDSDLCVGHHEVIEAAKRAEQPVCTSGFQCDVTRCIPVDWRCDGHVDCADQTDEIGCGDCASTTVEQSNPGKSKKFGIKDFITKSSTLHCGERRCMSSVHVCNGVMDCPWGQDERNCLRLSESNGDIGRGRLQVYHAENSTFIPACISHWESTSAQAICSLLGYTVANSSILSMKNKNITIREQKIDTLQQWRLAQKGSGNLLKELQACTDQNDYPTVELSCSEFACGRRRYHYGNSKVQSRIVGGTESVPGDWPFLAALLGGPMEVFYCAGVLISDQWILTASHCVGNHTDLSDWTIQLGITRRHAHTYLGEKRKVKRVVPHPHYNMGSAHDNDVALFQLEKPVNFHEHLRPVCLPKHDTEIAPGTICTVIGWGKKEDTDSSQYEPAVNEVKVPVLERELCNAWLEHKELNVTDGMICAGYPEGKKDACQGDSGGPLLCQDEKDKERWFVGGIVSWGIKCAHPRLPGVYAYVPKYVPWIRAQMAKYENHENG
ncbi:hypothetical protein HCN44_010539 [Aphidius gifuensis]|uniref:Atrial natriuretic peptide-converting enzyme n=1 Tax=Aphidius gifuensis TaxID=684658 RepID=A0A834XQT9_APHGI|nr:atrial natriuretic peptide-converting enzyme-like isoform X2 [Aphidius gifuensis]KAF7991738.1 hypothetical protein HCN44_010539 [Aphidius gifuensis]